MNAYPPAPSDKRHRFPPAIIAHAVRRYFRFALRYRDVEELLAERGGRRAAMSHRPSSIGSWCHDTSREWPLSSASFTERPIPGRLHLWS